MAGDEVFGYSWAEIQVRQQGTHKPKTVRLPTPTEQAQYIMRDVDKFKINVSRECVERLRLRLPEGYKLDEVTGAYIYEATA